MGYLLVGAVFVILVVLGLFVLSAAMLLVGRVLGLLFPVTTFQGALITTSWLWERSSPSCWGTWAGLGTMFRMRSPISRKKTRKMRKTTKTRKTKTRKMRSILPCGWPLIGERGSP